MAWRWPERRPSEAGGQGLPLRPSPRPPCLCPGEGERAFSPLPAPAKRVLASDGLLRRFPAELSYYFLIKKSPGFFVSIFL